MANTININNDEVVVLTNKLEKLHRSALPVAIRGTLNSAAFDVKQKTMPKSAERNFVNRNRNFFKANSRVEMATGFNVDTMKSTIGFVTSRLRGSDQAIEDLEEQEFGGTIKGRSFIPMDTARGGNKARAVRPGNRLSKIRNIVNAAKAKGKTKKEKFIKSVIHAGKGGYVLGNNNPRTLYKITSIIRRGNLMIVKKKPLYSFEEGRSVKVSRTGFMKSATLRSANKLNDFYIKEANRQIKRLTA